MLTDPTFGWNLTTPATLPTAWMNGAGAGLATATAFRAVNLNDDSGSFHNRLGTDSSGRQVYSPGAVPADGNYEFNIAKSAFSPNLSADVSVNDFFVHGDLNHDRVIDSDDTDILYANFYGRNSYSYSEADIDGDGDVDEADYDLITQRYNTRLAPAPAYAGNVTVSSLSVQEDGTVPLVVTWQAISDSVLQNYDAAYSTSTFAGYTVYRSEDGVDFEPLEDVSRTTFGQSHGYAYTDETPVDGVKYWYRIRPYFEKTMPNQSVVNEHLATTNKDWKVAALRGPTDTNVSRVGTQLFITWNDNSATETGFVIEQQSNTGSWVTIGTTSANVNSFAFDMSTLSGTSAGNDVRVTAVNSNTGIDRAAVVSTPASITPTYTLEATLLKRVDITLDTVGYEYDAGVSHAGETITVVDSGGGSGFVTGNYVLNSQGIVTLPISPSQLPVGVHQIQILFPSTTKEGVIDVGPDLFGLRQIDVGGGAAITVTGGVGTGTIRIGGGDGDEECASGQPIGAVAPATTPPCVITTGPGNASSGNGGSLSIPIIVSAPLPPSGTYTGTVVIVDGKKRIVVPIAITIP